MTMERLQYRIRPARPEAHLYRIVLTVTDPAPDGQLFSLPAWIPGSYMIRDFARHIVGIAARDAEGEPLRLEKLDKQTWRCEPAEQVTVEYEVYAWDLSVRGAHLDPTHAYFNGTSVFLRVHGFEEEPCAVEILPPEGDQYWQWQVATTLPSAGAEPYGFGHYRADSYAELIDHPVEMGSFTVIDFEAGGVPHALVITGRHETDGDRLAEDVKRICEHHIAFFGGLPPIERYLFLVTAVGDGYGGLEHGSSCSLICKRDDLPSPGRTEVNNGYRAFLGLCSHEYFHTWHVKRIRPAAFTFPDGLDREVHTRLLWVFEGFTSYYDDLALARTELITPESYLELLGQNVTRVLRGAGRTRQSIAESSFDAWTKFYKQDENAPNAIVSYYAKGGLVALTLDLHIRRESGGTRSLDDVMRLLWEEFGSVGHGIPEGAMAELITQATGVDVSALLGRYVEGTEDPPLAELLDFVGIDLRLRRPESPSDKGGKPPSKGDAELIRRPVLGINTAADFGARLTVVHQGGAAQEAGLAAGDVLVAVDGIRATHENLESLLGRYAPGAEVKIHAFRRDELMEFAVTLKAPPEDTAWLAIRDEGGPAAEKRRRWLNP